MTFTGYTESSRPSIIRIVSRELDFESPEKERSILKIIRDEKKESMPILTRRHLASRLRSNWMAKYPTDSNSNGGVTLDESLTSLNWLQNLNIMKIPTPTPPPSPEVDIMNARVNPNAVLNITNIPMKPEPRFHLADTPPGTPTSFGGDVDYKTNPYVKPPYSYATLICMSMKETNKTKITLSAIYNWITENFMYYRVADPSWQNSIRHNLSLNKCFQKVARRKDEPGKGGFWRINPEFVDMLENGVFKKRRTSRDDCLPVVKRFRQDDEFDFNDSHNEKRLRSDPNMVQIENVEMDDTRLPDFNWASIMEQDIDIGGVRVKTEQILDRAEYDASPLIAMSPPSSETNSDDLGIDDFLAQTFHVDSSSGSDGPLDYTSNAPLDLSVCGNSIKVPEWWEEVCGNENADPNIISRDRGLHTPVLESPSSHLDEDHHTPSWHVPEKDIDSLNDIAAAFDIDNLFDIEAIPSPKMG